MAPPPPPPSLPRSSSTSSAGSRPWPAHGAGSVSRPLASSFVVHDRRYSSTSNASNNMTASSRQIPEPTYDRSDSSRGHRASRAGNVVLSDRRLVTLANETAAMIQWDRILRAPEPRLARWKWVENAGDFSLYTRHESQRYAVLAIGVVRSSVAELASLLQSENDDQHVQRMEALYGDQFKHGAHVHDADLTSDELSPMIFTDGADESTLASLCVKTATFTKPNMLSSHEQWCYVDAVYTHKSGNIFEKHMTTLRPKDVLSGKCSSKTKEFHDVIGGYCVQPELPQEATDRLGDAARAKGASSKVHFYAELFTPKQFGFSVPTSVSALTERSIRHRLVRLAQSCSRLPSLVRRRRLGVQVLVDQNRLLPPTNVPCINCDRHLLLAKLCRLCGQGVCDDCSQKYERERHVRSYRIRIENVRVCVRCVERVDTADFAHLGDAAFRPARVYPDPAYAKPPGSVLTALLQDALVNASTHEMKASVMNVIKCVLDQETENDPAAVERPAESTQATAPPPAKLVLLTPSSSEKDYLHALLKLHIDPVSYEEAPVAEVAGRAYAVNPKNSPDIQMAHPVPENDDLRVKAIQDTHIRELGRSEELTLICELAARELSCFAVLVTIVDKDELYIAAANIPGVALSSFARNNSFCAHTVMSEDPLIVTHPEADVRFHQCQPVTMLGAKYYCGFPVIVENAVIGAVCCVDQKTRELNESQYAYLKKLADTAGKVVTLHANQKKRSLSTASDLRSEPRSEPEH